ncbi:TPA: hypothetical protein ACR3Z0_003867 [Bacillus thuringiensis]|uniref:Uncharacterized protein n=2 Tax=Bacillus cereus group TaxID=86661 RepID=A0A9X6QAG6_BACTU|nr:MULTISPECIES: hypothetical protein [Bacillus cereus group]AKR38663.1 Hypothetical protein NF53_p4012 [Bacillus thuringiensis serovar indiana]OTY74379.1 hypothetical protein BK753_00305 [Bacillus thuringiensis serovar canadensis]AJA23609.1 hypothetical protein BT4G5_32980 [Bacillus thuringiensis serovar galleriae]EJP82260.1 hypothetical protein IC1_05908 [Bacillus cereus VD022]EJQ96446.1 hypothetical protein II5_06028 [Bacillus cereus MSX-A1]
MSVDLLVSLFVYLLVLIFFGIGAYQTYALCTSLEERKLQRTKIAQSIQQKKKKFILANNKSKFQQKLSTAEIKYIKASHYQITRIVVLLFLAIYYLAIPYVTLGEFSVMSLLLVWGIYLATEPIFKYSIISIVINYLIALKYQKKMTEVFTLFDVLKADLYSLNPSQEVNIYGIIRDSLPMFEHIDGTIARFLSLWKSDPEKAKDVFHEDIGGEGTKALGDIIFKMDQTSKDQALETINAESSVFAFSYYEAQMQQSGKSKTLMFGVFTTTSLLIISWLVLYIFAMFSDILGKSHI